MNKCPVCGIEDEAVTIAVHLLERHHFTADQGMEWLRDVEEKCGR